MVEVPPIPSVPGPCCHDKGRPVTVHHCIHRDLRTANPNLKAGKLG